MAITNTALATAMSDLIEIWQDRENEMRAWLGGVVGGGPNSDGKYPLTDPDDVTILVTSPAQLQANVSNIVTGAGASATAAATSATAAASSATTASTQASNAAASASTASTQASNASSSASTATTGATTATAQATAASASATAAAASAASALAASGGITDPNFDAFMTWNNTTNLPVWAAGAPAVKGSANTFTAAQTMNLAGAGLVMKGAATGSSNTTFLEFRDSAGTRQGYLGRSTTSDARIEIGADLALANVVLTPGSGGSVVLGGVQSAADDTAAAALGNPVPVGGLYRTGSALKIRVS